MDSFREIFFSKLLDSFRKDSYTNPASLRITKAHAAMTGWLELSSLSLFHAFYTKEKEYLKGGGGAV